MAPAPCNGEMWCSTAQAMHIHVQSPVVARKHLHFHTATASVASACTRVRMITIPSNTTNRPYAAHATALG